MKKNKLLIAFLLTVFCFSLACPAVMAVDALPLPDAVPVSTAEDLLSIKENPSGSYVLTDHIDLAGIDWVPFAFSGILDGNGFTVYNVGIGSVGGETAVTWDGNDKEYETCLSGFFTLLKTAEIRNLTLMNVRMDVECRENVSAGLLAGFAEDSKVENCHIYGTAGLVSGNTMTALGGFFGFGKNSAVDSSSIECTLVHNDDCRDKKSEDFVGGFMAAGYGSINKSVIHVEGYDSCHGYVHDGGLVGMADPHDETLPCLYSNKNVISGFITFFEDNTDRRAYCNAFCGENMHWKMAHDDNESTFESLEVFAYDKNLVPHECAEPQYSEAVSENTCTEWGFVEYTCDACGYSYRDKYVPPCHVPGEPEITKEATLTESGLRETRCTVCGEVVLSEEIAPHVPGDWITEIEPQYGKDGMRRIYCTDCGEILEEEILPAPVQTDAIELSSTQLRMNYKEEGHVTAEVLPVDAEDRTVVWSSSDSSVVSVDERGWITAVSPGEAVITCCSVDGGASADCSVRVSYSFGQHCVRIFLLGFLWY